MRSIRHGVNPEGRGLVAMPASDYALMSASDLGSVIVYIKTLPPIDNENHSIEFQWMGKVLLSSGAFDGIISAEVIDHTLPVPQEPDRKTTEKLGEYMVNIFGCRTCHGPELKGMQPPIPGAPYAPSLQRDGNLSKWSDEIFLATIRKGETPEGKAMDEKFMPWKVMSRLHEEELSAIYVYLMSL